MPFTNGAGPISKLSCKSDTTFSNERTPKPNTIDALNNPITNPAAAAVSGRHANQSVEAAPAGVSARCEKGTGRLSAVCADSAAASSAESRLSASRYQSRNAASVLSCCSNASVSASVIVPEM